LKVLENPESPTDVEIVLDAVCRTSHLRTDEDLELMPALLKRAESKIKTKAESRHTDKVDLIRSHLASLAIALVKHWTLPKCASNALIEIERFTNGYYVVSSPHFDDIFHRRNEWILSIARMEKYIPLLSTPSNTDFLISGDELLNKISVYKTEDIETNEVDLTLSLMRLRVEDRHQVFSQLPKTMFTEKLVQDIENPPTEAILDPDEELGYFSRIGPKNGINVVDYDGYCVDLFRLKKEHESNRFYRVPLGSINTQRWISTIWPTNYEAYLAHAASNFDYYQNLSNSPYQAFFELMHHRTIGKLVPTIFPTSIPLPRLVKTLRELLDIAPDTASSLRCFVCEIFQYDPKAPPTGIAGLIDFLHELILHDNVPLDNPVSVNFLLNLKPTTSASKAAKRLLPYIQSHAA